MSRKADWRRFVERRRVELRGAYPCAAPTARRICPKHRIPVPQETEIKTGPNRCERIRLSGVCKPCRDELFEQLAAEYIAAPVAERRSSMTMTLFDEYGEPEGPPEEELRAAEAMLVLAEIARERGLARIADLGNLPSLTPETRARYLALAKARREGDDGD
jgi:hypothetical protein